MKGIFSVLVENKDGVLSQISGLFARRGFNIDSLAVGETERHDISSMTIVSTGDQRTVDQIEKHLNKKLDVIKVRRLEETILVLGRQLAQLLTHPLQLLLTELGLTQLLLPLGQPLLQRLATAEQGAHQLIPLNRALA